MCCHTLPVCTRAHSCASGTGAASSAWHPTPTLPRGCHGAVYGDGPVMTRYCFFEAQPLTFLSPLRPPLHTPHPQPSPTTTNSLPAGNHNYFSFHLPALNHPRPPCLRRCCDCFTIAMRCAHAVLRTVQRYALQQRCALHSATRCRVLCTRVLQGLQHGAAALHAHASVCTARRRVRGVLATRVCTPPEAPGGRPGGCRAHY